MEGIQCIPIQSSSLGNYCWELPWATKQRFEHSLKRGKVLQARIHTASDVRLLRSLFCGTLSSLSRGSRRSSLSQGDRSAPLQPRLVSSCPEGTHVGCETARSMRTRNRPSRKWCSKGYLMQCALSLCMTLFSDNSSLLLRPNHNPLSLIRVFFGFVFWSWQWLRVWFRAWDLSLRSAF